MELKMVEIKVGYEGKPAEVSDSLFVEIPADTPGDRLEDAARDAFEKMVATWNTPYVFQEARRVLARTPSHEVEVDDGGW